MRFLHCILFFCGLANAEPMRPGGLSGDGCKAQGGRIESIGPLLECNENEFFYGRVLGMKCGCICCGPKAELAAKDGAPPKTPLLGIPKPNQDLYQDLRDAQWRNPFLILRSTEVEVRGLGTFPMNQIESVLLGLPKDAWPYGRVVALKVPPKNSKRVADIKFFSIMERLRVHVSQR